jgi:hypothetical protein
MTNKDTLIPAFESWARKAATMYGLPSCGRSTTEMTKGNFADIANIPASGNSATVE